MIELYISLYRAVVNTFDVTVTSYVPYKVPSISVAGLEEALGEINEIWAQASIKFQKREIKSVSFPEPPVLTTNVRNWDSHTALDYAIKELPASGAHILGVCSGWLDSDNKNGLSRPGTAAAFSVKDTPQLDPVPFDTDFYTDNYVARVCSHEIGHILGLDHFNTPDKERDRLMFAGSQGTRLIPSEIAEARTEAARLSNPHLP